MPQVETVRTVTTPEQAESAIREAWLRRFGEQPENGTLRNLLALWDLETNIGASQFNHNFGNQIATRDTQPFYLADDSGNLRRFRAYASRAEGADSFVSQMTSATRPNWVEGLVSGNPEFFAKRLKGDQSKGEFAYYEASITRYTPRLVQGFNRYQHLRVDNGRPPGGAGAGAVLLVLAAIGLGAAYYGLRKRPG